MANPGNISGSRKTISLTGITSVTPKTSAVFPCQGVNHLTVYYSADLGTLTDIKWFFLISYDGISFFPYCPPKEPAVSTVFYDYKQYIDRYTCSTGTTTGAFYMPMMSSFFVAIAVGVGIGTGTLSIVAENSVA